MKLHILGVPVTIDFSLPMTEGEIGTKLDEWEKLLDQGKQQEADALYDELTEAGALDGWTGGNE